MTLDGEIVVIDPVSSNVLEGVDVALDQFFAPAIPLPPGPKAIIVVTDGGENYSKVTQEAVVALANDNSIPVFTVGVGDVSITQRVELLTSLATDTGGQYFPAPTETDIIAASATFTRRDCDATPDSFSFATSAGVSRNSSVTSSPVTISGLEIPADISVDGGTYSIGCGSTFTATDGVISNGQTEATYRRPLHREPPQDHPVAAAAQSVWFSYCFISPRMVQAVAGESE